MYQINGFDLDSNSLGGWLHQESQPYAGISRRSNSFAAGSRDGRISVPWQNDAPVIVLVERLPAEHLESFMSVLNAPTGLTLERTDTPGRSASVELTSVSVENLPTYVPAVDVRFALQFNDVYWRSTEEITSAPVSIGPPETFTTVSVFPDQSAPIRDAIIRVKGSVTGLTVYTGPDSWFEYQPNISSTSYFRFHSDTGRAFITNSDTWDGGTEVTGSVKNGPPPYFFEIIPLIPEDFPQARNGHFEVEVAARSGSPTIEVRGRNAFLV